MAHTINCIIFNTNSHHNVKNFIQLNNNIGITLKTKGLPEIYISIFTDYFGGGGGGGNQGVKINFNNTSLLINGYDLEFSKNFNLFRPINMGLRLLGVIADKDKDEFDTVGLGSFRDDENIIKVLKQQKKENIKK